MTTEPEACTCASATNVIALGLAGAPLPARCPQHQPVEARGTNLNDDAIANALAVALTGRPADPTTPLDAA